MYLSLYCKGSKRVTQGFTVRGSWRPNRTAIYWPPTLMAVNVVSFSFSWCSTRGPGAQLSAECWLSLPHLISNFSGPQLNRGPRGPLWPSVAFPTTSRLYKSNSNCSLTVLTELNNSSTSTQSPTQSLEWHVWSSSSGNNCHAVQRSLSSGASVYECIMGFFPGPILLARSAYAIFPHKCHRNVSLPSGASPWNGIFGQVEGQNATFMDSFGKQCCIYQTLHTRRMWHKANFKRLSTDLNSRIISLWTIAILNLKSPVYPISYP